MNADSTGTRSIRRGILWGLPSLAVHLAIVGFVAVAVVALGWRGDSGPLKTVSDVAGGIAVVALATLLAAVVRAGLHDPDRRLLALGVSAIFASSLCSLLAGLAVFTSVARPLHVAYWAFSAVGLPTLLVLVWRLVRGGGRPG